MTEPTTHPTHDLPLPSDGQVPAVPGYEILGEIARGGMGIVYKARQQALGRIVALKVMIAGEHATLEALQRFLLEARSAARIDHPNVVQVYEAGSEGPFHYFTMRYVEGVALSRLIREQPFPVPRALQIARTVLLALDAAHRQGVIHRDVKPGNIMIDGSGEPHVTDFGLAKDLAGERLTAPGVAMGTPVYAPPEQVSGEMDRVGPWSDVYSVGASLYEMLTCRVPFVGESIFAVMQAILATEPIPPRAINPQVPPEVEAIVLKALEKEPERRYPTAMAMAEDLRRAVEGEAIDARPSSAFWRAGRRVLRRPRFLLSVAAAMLVLAGVATWAFVAADRKAAELADFRATASRAEAEADGATDRTARKAALVQARDALIGVERLSGERPAALPGIEARLAVIEAEESTGRDQAVRSARSAEEALRKSELLAAVFGRWSRLRDALREMEAARYDARLSVEVTLERTKGGRDRVDRFLAETPGDPTSRAAALALAGWGLRLSGQEAEGLEQMREAARLDPDVPYGALLEALTLFVAYSEGQDLPEIHTTRGGVTLGDPPGESEERAELRGRMEGLIEAARAARVWGKEGSEDLAAAIAGIRAWQRGEYEEAEGALSKALDAPDLSAFGTGLLLARGKLRYLRQDFAGAKADLEAVLAARPGAIDPILNVAMARLGEAIVLAGRGGDAVPLLEQAAAGFEEVITLAEDPLGGHNGLALCAQERAAAEAARGGDPRPWWRRAAGSLDFLIARNPKEILAWSNRAMLHRRVAEWEARNGKDPRESFGKALTDCDETIRLSPGVPLFHTNRAIARRMLGDWLVAHGEDGTGSYEAALSDCDEAIGFEPGNKRLRIPRGNTLLALASQDVAGREKLLERALADFDAAIEADARSLTALTGRAVALEGLGRVADAVAAYEAALALSPGDPALRERLTRLRGRR